LESGLARREHPLGNIGDQNWEDVGAAWDDLVGDDDDAGSMEWAHDAEGQEYQLFGKRAYEAGYVPPEEVGPMGELPDYARVSSAVSDAMPDGASERTMLGAIVAGDGTVHFQLSETSVLEARMPSNEDIAVTADTNAAIDVEDPGQGSAIEVGPVAQNASAVVHKPIPAANGADTSSMLVPAPVRDSYSISSSDGSPVEKLSAALEAMGLNRGRHQTRSPIRNEVSSEPSW